MHRLKSWLCGLGVGAGFMYYGDPVNGRRRRALVRDQIVSTGNEFIKFLDVAWRDLKNRVQGLIAEGKSYLSGPGKATDEVLISRVRSALGRVVSHPRAIKVGTRDGRILLAGPVLASEVSNLVACVSAVSGVQGVDNRLEVHENANNHPSLQGGSAGVGVSMRWSPATRMLAGGLGTYLMARCMVRGTVGSKLLGAAGFGLFIRSLADTDFARSLGLSADTGSSRSATGATQTGRQTTDRLDGAEQPLRTAPNQAPATPIPLPV